MVRIFHKKMTMPTKESMIAQMNEVGSVGALYRYPVKSMMGEELNATLFGNKGVVGDRLFALSDPETGKIASASALSPKMMA